MFRLETAEAETETEREAESFGVKPVQRRRNRRPEAEGKTHTSAKDESTKESASNVPCVFYTHLLIMNVGVFGC